MTKFSNPYQSAGTRWLRGEIHTHVNKAHGSKHKYPDGVSCHAIYKAASKAGLDFVCMSVDVTHALGGGHCFGDVGPGRAHNVTGIPAREIQNNYYGGELFDDYFAEPGADYLHVLTIKPGGLAICLHPRYYEMANKKAGGCWADIRTALLHPIPSGRLDDLKVCGIEIYNGFTLDRLRRKGKEHEYCNYDEYCWDDLLKQGRRFWGFAGNDAFFKADDKYTLFRPLGCVYVSVDHGHSKHAIADGMKHGRFYSSSGIVLADDPISVRVEDKRLIVEGRARKAVKWKARVFEQVSQGWCLNSYTTASSSTAEFVIGNPWKFVRLQCEDPHDPWQRAWLQPVTNRDTFGH